MQCLPAVAILDRRIVVGRQTSTPIRWLRTQYNERLSAGGSELCDVLLAPSGRSIWGPPDSELVQTQ